MFIIFGGSITRKLLAVDKSEGKWIISSDTLATRSWPFSIANSIGVSICVPFSFSNLVHIILQGIPIY